MRIVLAGLLAIGVTGCAPLPPYIAVGQTPPDQVVRVVMGEPNMGSAQIVCVDGQRSFGVTREAHLPPGRHYLGIHWYTTGSMGYSLSSDQAVWFDATPGRAYVAEVHATLGVYVFVEMRIKDQATGSAPVSGRLIPSQVDPASREKQCVPEET